MPVSVSFPNAFDDLEKFARLRAEAAALEATRRAAVIAKGRIRDGMKNAGLGRLGNAVDQSSDAEKRGSVYRQGEGFSASGVVFVRSRSERTLGAIESYTQPETTILPVRGKWLWIPTDAMQRVAGKAKSRQRLTPGNWQQLGMEKKLGPLRYLKSVNGRPLLAVENVGVSATGAARSARSLTKKGYARKGQVKRELLVCFIAIPRTSRRARIDVQAILQSVAQELPALFNDALGRIS